MNYHAYWLSPQGDILPVPIIHIQVVIDQPERFGLTLATLKRCYASHREPLGHEGLARLEIMAGLIAGQGWVRVRYTPRQDRWTVELARLDDPARHMLRDFFLLLCGNAIGSTRAIDRVSPYADVCINELHDLQTGAQLVLPLRELLAWPVANGHESVVRLEARSQSWE